MSGSQVKQKSQVVLQEEPHLADEEEPVRKKQNKTKTNQNKQTKKYSNVWAWVSPHNDNE